jgi:hypothetical protein
MEANIVCPFCLTEQNSYKCENICNYCTTIYCIICNEPFHIINNICIKGHNKCYIKSKI